MRICVNCGSDKTYIDKTGHKGWYNHNGWYCEKCNSRLFKNPRRMRFKDKHLLLKERVLTGKCSICGYQGLTHTHHFEYDELNPLAHTIELCAGCHRKLR